MTRIPSFSKASPFESRCCEQEAGLDVPKISGFGTADASDDGSMFRGGAPKTSPIGPFARLSSCR
jgi:hypothetical protein